MSVSPTLGLVNPPIPSLLIEAAWMWKQRDLGAEAFDRRILGRSGLPQKAIVAVARKLAILRWRLNLSPAVA